MRWLERWRRGLPEHPTARAYAEGTQSRRGRREPLSDLSILAIDLETSGMRVGKDRILSVGGVDVSRGRVEVGSAFSWYVRHPDAQVTEATRVHGILPADTAAGMPEERALEALLPRLTGAVVVGHHVGFDGSMLSEALKRHFGVRLRNELVDTAQLAAIAIEAFHRAGYPRQPPPSLEEVCTYLGIPMMDRHTALGDAFTAGTLFLLLCARLRRLRGRPLVWGDLPGGRI